MVKPLVPFNTDDFSGDPGVYISACIEMAAEEGYPPVVRLTCSKAMQFVTSGAIKSHLSVTAEYRVTNLATGKTSWRPLSSPLLADNYADLLRLWAERLDAFTNEDY